MDPLAPVVSTVPPRGDATLLDLLSSQERAIYDALLARPGRVVSRFELAKAAGIADLSPRRVDSLLVGIRRVLGPGRIRGVRRRGWILVLGGV